MPVEASWAVENTDDLRNGGISKPVFLDLRYEHRVASRSLQHRRCFLQTSLRLQMTRPEPALCAATIALKEILDAARSTREALRGGPVVRLAHIAPRPPTHGFSLAGRISSNRSHLVAEALSNAALRPFSLSSVS